jgi:hypothetical protein
LISGRGPRGRGIEGNLFRGVQLEDVEEVEIEDALIENTALPEGGGGFGALSGDGLQIVGPCMVDITDSDFINNERVGLVFDLDGEPFANASLSFTDVDVGADRVMDALGAKIQNTSGSTTAWDSGINRLDGVDRTRDEAATPLDIPDFVTTSTT